MKKEQEKQDEIESSNAPLIEHLSELRSRLVVSVLAFLVCMVCVFPFSSVDLFKNLLPTVGNFKMGNH